MPISNIIGGDYQYIFLDGKNTRATYIALYIYTYIYILYV